MTKECVGKKQDGFDFEGYIACHTDDDRQTEFSLTKQTGIFLLLYQGQVTHFKTKILISCLMITSIHNSKFNVPTNSH